MTEGTQPLELNLNNTESGIGSQNRLFDKRWKPIILIAAVCLLVLAVYWPVLSARALCYDDNRYFVLNPLVRNPGWNSAWRFLSEVSNPSTVGGYYQPLTMISLMLDYALVGPTNDITQFHRTALTLHIANTALIVVLIYLLFGRRIWIASATGLLFGLHPLTVEAVAWIGERKTLLAAFFALWSLVCYVHYAQSRKKGFFIGSIVTYMLALLSKPTSTPLPVIMLLIDYWPMRRLSRSAILEKLPFFALGGISGIITIISQSKGASIITPEVYGAMRVPLVICHNIIFYPSKMLWPFNLTPHNPFPNPLNLSQPMILIGVIGTFLLIIALLVSLRRTRGAMIGWLIFFIMVLPTMQALQFSDVIASDKFVYLPSLGVLLMLGGFLCWIFSPQKEKSGLTARGVAAVIMVLAIVSGESVATRKYLASWRDSMSLWTHMVKVTPHAVSPRNNLGTEYFEMGDFDKAMEQFKIALALDPNNVSTISNIGSTLSSQGKKDEAKYYYEKAIKLNPTGSEGYYSLGLLLISQDKLEEAINLYQGALTKKLQYPFLMYKGIGHLMVRMGQFDEAIKALEKAVILRSDSETYANLGQAYAEKGDLEKATENYKKAIMMDPNNPEAHYNLGNAYLSQDRLMEAAGEYQKAIKAKPNYAKAYSNLGVVLLSIGRDDEAIEKYRRAAELDPNNVEAKFNLGTTLAEKGLLDEAVENLQKVVERLPENTVARCRFADVLVRQGRIERAIAEYEQVLKIDPGNTDAQEGLKKAKETLSGK